METQPKWMKQMMWRRRLWRIIIGGDILLIVGLIFGNFFEYYTTKEYETNTQRFTEYWRHKADSLSDENFKLYMQIYELEDSIITLRFGRYSN